MTALTSTLINSGCLQLVSNEYERLQGAIEGLGTAVEGSLGCQKHELETKHKIELSKAQENADALSKEKTRLEDSIAANERACQLEIERDWYKKEASHHALHLDEVLEQTKAQQKDLSNRLEESEQDRKWLKGQVEKLTLRLREHGVETDGAGDALSKSMEAATLEMPGRN
ncbi:hypothetical protein ACHAXT_001084 [Thalassiosira profunda]